MKKRFRMRIIIGCFFVASIFIFTGLVSAATITDQKKNFRFIGASPGGTYFIVLGGLSEAINKNIPNWSTTVEPGTAVSDIFRIAKGDGDLALSQNNVILDIMKKEGKEYQKLCSLGAIATSGAQLVALKSLNLTTFDQFVNQKPKLNISFGPSFEVHYLAA